MRELTTSTPKNNNNNNKQTNRKTKVNTSRKPTKTKRKTTPYIKLTEPHNDVLRRESERERVVACPTQIPAPWRRPPSQQKIAISSASNQPTPLPAHRKEKLALRDEDRGGRVSRRGLGGGVGGSREEEQGRGWRSCNRIPCGHGWLKCVGTWGQGEENYWTIDNLLSAVKCMAGRVCKDANSFQRKS